MRALLIDSDEVALQILIPTMTRGGFTVHTATGSESALNHLICNRYEIIILRYSVRDHHGQRLYDRLHQAGLSTPILLVAARGEHINEDSIVSVTKDAVFFEPVDAQELLDWSKALIDFTNIIVEFMDFPFIHRKETHKQDTKRTKESSRHIDLTLYERKLLGFLLKNRGRTVHKSEILESVWESEEEETFTNIVEVYITRLRRKLGAHGKNLLTIRGVGYRFEI